MFTEHVGNLQAANSLDQLKQVLEQILGDCESALTHNGTLDINGALPAGSTGAVVNISNGYIAPNDATTEPDDNGNLPNGWALAVDGGAWFKGQVKFDQGGAGGNLFWQIVPPGVLIQWGKDHSLIPTGFVECDGTANHTSLGGTGIDMRGQVPYGRGSGDFATVGDSIAIALASSISGDGTTASLTITSTSSNIGVGDHPSGQSCTVTDPGHTHAYGASNQGTATPGGDDVSISTPLQDAYTGITVTTPTLTHSVTDSGHTHLGSVSADTIAGKLSIGTPTTVRPAGKVVAFIEKLAV